MSYISDHNRDFLDFPGLNGASVDKSSPVWTVYARLEPRPVICPHCNHAELQHKGTTEMSFWDAPVRGYRIRVTVTRRHYKCKKCARTFSEPVPGLDVDHRVTLRCVDYILHRVGTKRWTLREVANEVGADEKTIGAIFTRYFSRMQSRLQQIDRFKIVIEVKELNPGKYECRIRDVVDGKNFRWEFEKRDLPTVLEFLASMGGGAPRRLGIDEYHLGGQKYCCVLIDLDTGEFFDMIFDKDNADAMGAYFYLLRVRHRTTLITMDMSRQFRALAHEYFPGAACKICVDRFHIVQAILKRFKSILSPFERKLRGERREQFRNDRYSLFQQEPLSTGKGLRIEELLQTYPALAEARRACEQLIGLYTQGENSTHASKLYESLKASFTHRQKQQFRIILNTMDEWSEEIFSFFDTRLTNGRTESLNRLSRERMRLGRGCSYRLLRSVMIYRRILRETLELMGQSVPTYGQVLIAELLNDEATDKTAKRSTEAVKINPAGLFLLKNEPNQDTPGTDETGEPDAA